jgi:PAS domain S-box-containing protein
MFMSEENQGSSALSEQGTISISSRELGPLLDVLPDALVIVNQQGTIVLVNKQAEKIFGYTQAELQGQTIEKLIPQRFRQLHVAHRQHYSKAPRTRPMGLGLQLYGTRKDGSEFPVDISLRPLQLDDQPHVIAAIRDVTAQRRAQRERMQQLQQIQRQSEIINLAYDAILIRDPIGRVLFWNHGAERLYGWSTQEALGRIANTLLKTRFPDGKATVNDDLEQKGKWEGELIHSDRNGNMLIVESRQVLVRDQATNEPSAVLEINRDVTERHRQEQKQQAVHAETLARLSFLREVLDALPNGIQIVYGPKARLLLANRATHRMWGAYWKQDQPMEDFLKQHNIHVLDANQQEMALSSFATLRAARKGETVLYHQETIRQPDGTSLPVLVNAIPVRKKQADISFLLQSDTESVEQQQLAIVVYQDVTPLKEAEYLKDEFIGIVAHELRTPLAVLMGYADTLLVQSARGHGAPLADWQQDALQDIKQATERLVTLTDGLLDVTRLQAGRLLLHCTATDLDALVQRVASHLQQTTSQHQLEVHLHTPAAIVYMDPQRIDQVLTNLIENAIKYSPQGGPIWIKVRTNPEQQTAIVSVQDRGIGIPKRQQGQIFGRFMRADNAQAWGITGTGLGLYLCRQLVERHKGQLWFESEEGVGSTFFMSLPLLSLRDEETSPPTTSAN